WNFALDGHAVQFLSFGQTLALDYHVIVMDPFGLTTFQDVSVTIVGTDNAPVVSAAVVGGGNEDTSFAVDLLQNASDVDHGSVLHTANVVWSELPGSLPAGFSLVGNAIAVDATAPAYQNLAQGETFTTHFTYDVVDQFGASV